MDIVQKIQNILLKPKETFVTLKAEKQDLMSLLTGYVLLLAALPAIGSALGMIRFPSWAIRMAIVGYVTALAVYFGGAFLLQVLSKNFGGNGDLAQAAKTIAYSMTAGWVAGIATFIPVLGMLISLAGGIYSLYLLYLALPVFMDVPQDKVVGLEVIFVVALIIVGFAITFLLSSIFAVGYYTSPLARY